MGFRDRPQQLWWRKALFQVHLWCGLLVGLELLLVGLSGSILVFYPELHEWQEPSVALRAGVSSLPIGELTKHAEHKFPGLKFPWIILPDSASRPVRLQSNAEREGRGLYAYLHPQTGEVLGDTIEREWFLDWTYRFHMLLLAGDTGFTINAICAMAGAVMCFTGAILWWPGIKSWARAWKVNLQTGWKRINYDIHSAVGFFSLVCLAVVFVTGVYFRFPDPFVDSMKWLSQSEGWPDAPPAKPRHTARITPEQAIAIAERSIPNAVTSNIDLPVEPTDIYYVGRLRESDGIPYAGNGAYIDPYTGDMLLRYIRAERTTPTTLLQEWIGFLHFGTFGGLLTRVLWVLLGIVPGLLFATGALMYWNRSLSKRARASARTG